MTDALNAFLDPIRERAAHYAAQSGLVDEIIYDGTHAHARDRRRNDARGQEGDGDDQHVQPHRAQGRGTEEEDRDEVRTRKRGEEIEEVGPGNPGLVSLSTCFPITLE